MLSLTSWSVLLIIATIELAAILSLKVMVDNWREDGASLILITFNLTAFSIDSPPASVVLRRIS